MKLDNSDTSCAICKIKVQNDDKIVFCTNCDQGYHFDHLSQWLINENKCPQCKHIFSFAFMRHLRPQGNNFNSNSNEKDQLDKIFANRNYSQYQNKTKKAGTEGQKEDADYLAAISTFVLIMFMIVFFVGLFDMS